VFLEKRQKSPAAIHGAKEVHLHDPLKIRCASADELGRCGNRCIVNQQVNIAVDACDLGRRALNSLLGTDIRDVMGHQNSRLVEFFPHLQKFG
jgi:hypothetical protein